MTLQQNNELLEQKTEESPLPRPGGRGRRLLAAGAVLTAGLLAWGLASHFTRQTEPPPDPPWVDREDSPSAVAQALQQAREAVISRPHSAVTWGRYGMCLYAHDYPAEALQCFVEAERLNPQDHRWPYLQGICTTFTDPERGLDCFERSAALNPDLDAVRLRAAELAIQFNRADQAEAHLRAVLNRNPHDPRANLAFARLALARGNLSLAREKARQSLQFAPEVRPTHELLAKICFQLQEHAAAQEHLEAMRQATRSDDWPDPILSEVMQMRRDAGWELFQVQMLLDQGQTQLAIARLTRLVEEYPDSVEARLEFVRAWLSLGDRIQAARVLDQGLELHPRSARLHRLRGELHSTLNENRLALKQFQRAIELKPDYGLAHYNLGQCLEELGDSPGALRAYQEAYRLQPDLPGLKEKISRSAQTP